MANFCIRLTCCMTTCIAILLFSHLGGHDKLLRRVVVHSLDHHQHVVMMSPDMHAVSPGGGISGGFKSVRLPWSQLCNEP